MRLIANATASFNSFAWWLVQPGLWFALFSFFWPIAIDRLKRVGRADDLARGLAILGAFSLIPFMAGFSLMRFAGAKSPLGVIPAELMIYYFSLWGLSFALGFVFLREASGVLDKLKSRATKRTSLERNRKTDVREIRKFLPDDAPQYDPREYFNLKNGLFFGLDERRKLAYLDYENFRIQHVLLTGRTRSGKGVAAQIVIPQLIERGEYVVVLDPKRDNWMPHVFHAACQKAGVPYHYIDLNQSAPAQLNPFAGCDSETLENMLIGGFSLGEKGEAADFYRLGDRKAARRCAAWLSANPGATARDAVAALGDVWAEDARAFLEYMREMAELAPVNAAGSGLDLANGLKLGGLLYVAGDMINPRILRMQRMILLRLLFLAKQTTHVENRRTIMVFADEFKTHISRPFMVSLGASAGWGLHTMLAFQSLQDLSDCPADLDARAVQGAVLENCAVQLSYALKDPDTAEWLSRSTGTILVDDEMRRVNRNAGLAEVVSGDRSIRQSERPYIDLNMFLHMPNGCGVLNVPGALPRFVYTSPVRVNRTGQAIQVTPASGREQQPAGRDPLL